MGVIDDNDIKVNGKLLTGIIKSLEIKGSAIIEELEVEGKGKKPIQATGFDDSSINIELILLDDIQGKTKEEKLQVIQDIFKSKNQKVPNIYDIVNKYINQRGIYKVIIKDFSSKIANNKSEISVSLSLREYEAITIKASNSKKVTTTTNKKVTSNKNATNKINIISNSNNLTISDDDWGKYLNGSRGTSPTKNNTNKGRTDPFKNSPISPYFKNKRG
ncbi:hypothetical protein [[Clostridium] colinum]|uniref:hypothetical protein n=1 Tax=[Clostridium] colinum TaxID=36835 RepID=UPI0020242C1E|nr:hypothetical protein [[Clostridium] colinum]